MQSRCSTSYGACAETATPDSTNRPPPRKCRLTFNTRAPDTCSATPALPGANVDEKDRARFLTLRRRKLQRFEDIVDDLQDLVTDGSPTSRELEDREKIIEEFREEARRLSASFAGGAPSVFVEEKAPETMLGKLEHFVDVARSKAVEVQGEVHAKIGAATATAQEQMRKHEEAAAVRGLSSKELLELQQTQMRKQDDAMDKLDGLVGKLKMTSNMIKDEVDLQAKMVEDLDKDFTHTQNRMKKLRKQGFKLSGEKNAEAKEEYEKKEALQEMQKNLPSYQREMAKKKEEDNCVIM